MFYKKNILKISINSQENTCAGISLTPETPLNCDFSKGVFFGIVGNL